MVFAVVRTHFTRKTPACLVHRTAIDIINSSLSIIMNTSLQLVAGCSSGWNDSLTLGRLEFKSVREKKFFFHSFSFLSFLSFLFGGD